MTLDQLQAGDEFDYTCGTIRRSGRVIRKSITGVTVAWFETVMFKTRDGETVTFQQSNIVTVSHSTPITSR